ncbi:hypothetical protein C8R45DRAFT_1036463 [Mycena sanguinolenta]|nr:hypothetical protein C8R45DRAFT_1036463 [Mycena sanguinolenta]
MTPAIARNSAVPPLLSVFVLERSGVLVGLLWSTLHKLQAAAIYVTALASFLPVPLTSRHVDFAGTEEGDPLRRLLASKMTDIQYEGTSITNTRVF